jgi:hypothetical protein
MGLIRCSVTLLAFLEWQDVLVRGDEWLSFIVSNTHPAYFCEFTRVRWLHTLLRGQFSTLLYQCARFQGWQGCDRAL